MLKIFKIKFHIKTMKGIGIWIITGIILILFILGLTYYRMIDSVVNPLAFVISFAIIFIVLAIIIISSLKK